MVLFRPFAFRRSVWRSGLVVALLLFGCNKEAPTTSAEIPASVTARQTVAAVGAAPAAQPGTPAGPRVAEETFELVLSANGPFEVGKLGTAELVLEAKDPYKVNDKYPYKFKPKEAPGIRYASAVVGKEQVKLEAKRATMPVAFTPEKPGKHTVAGQFAFSVCTDDKCLIERRDLALEIQVN